MKVRSHVLVAAVLLLLGVSAVALRVNHHPRLSPLDEMVHLDYVDRAGHGGFIHIGDLVREQSLAIAVCRGGDGSPPDPNLRCAGPHNARQFAAEGRNTADIHSPLYYSVTALMQRILREIGVVDDDLLTASRLVGGLWLGMGLVVLWLLAAELGASPPARWGVSLLILASPLVIQQSGTVNVDAASLLCGGSLGLASLRYLKQRCGLWLLALVSAACVAVKATHLVVVLLVVGWLGWEALSRRGAGVPLREALSQRDSPARRLMVGAFAVAGAGAGAQLTWLLVRAWGAHEADRTTAISQQFHVNHLTTPQLASQLFAFASPLDGPAVPTPLSGSWIDVGVRLTGLVLVAAVLGAWFSASSFTSASRLGLATTVAMFTGPLLLVVLTFIAQGAYVPIPGRYGLALVPFMAVLLAVLASKTRRSGAILLVGAAVLCTATFVDLATTASV